MGLSHRVQQRIKGKAISHKPELAGRVHVLSTGGRGEAFPEMDSFAGYATIYDSYIWLRKGIRFIADSIKFLPVMVVDKMGEEQKGHYLTDLLAYVNDSENQTDLWEKWVIYKFLGGEFPMEIVPDKRGNPVELWARRPDLVNVIPDISPDRVLYPRVAGYRYLENRGEIIEPQLMWFDKYTNPLNQWRGLSVIRAAMEDIQIDVYTRRSIKTFQQKGARPDYALVTPQGMTNTEKDRIEADLIRKFSGYDKVHLPIVLEEGITDIKPFSFAPKDIQWIETSKYARDGVGAILNLPDLLMGYGSESYDNSDKMNAHLLYYWTMNGTPLVRSRDVGLTTFFHQFYPRILDKRHRLETDLSSVTVLRQDYSEKLTQAQQLFVMGVPFEQINERLELGVEYTPPAPVQAVDNGAKSQELERFRRWVKKRSKDGKGLDLAQFESGILTHADKAKELETIKGDGVTVMPPFQMRDYPLRQTH